MYMWAISCVSFACMWCICLFNVICFHYNRVDKGYTLRLMSLLCCCFILLTTSLLANTRKQLWFCFFLGGILYFFHWDIYVVVFSSSLHCFGTKINRVVTSKFDYWVCLFFFVYSWWVDKISMIYKMNHLAITIQINESWVHQNHRVTMIAAKSAYSCNLYHNITD